MKYELEDEDLELLSLNIGKAGGSVRPDVLRLALGALVRIPEPDYFAVVRETDKRGEPSTYWVRWPFAEWTNSTGTRRSWMEIPRPVLIRDGVSL